MKKFVEESWLVVTMGVVFACLLAGTKISLSERIGANERRAVDNAVAEVVPDLDHAEELEIDGNTVFKCLGANNELTGWAVQAAGTGFVDKITLVVGLSADGAQVTGLKVISNVETPGLGNKIAGEWAGQYRGLDATRELTVVKGSRSTTDNEIQAITGATYSSTYVTDIVNDVLNRIRPKLAEYR